MFKQLLLTSLVSFSCTALAGGSVSTGLTRFEADQPLTSSLEVPTEDYLASPLAQDFLASFFNPELSYRADLNQVLVDQICGFAGCSASYLIGHSLSSLAPNSSTHGQLAVVSYDPIGKLEGVALASLVMFPGAQSVELPGERFADNERLISIASSVDFVAERLNTWTSDNVEIRAPFITKLSAQCGFVGCGGTDLIVFSARSLDNTGRIETIALTVTTSSGGFGMTTVSEVLVLPSSVPVN